VLWDCVTPPQMIVFQCLEMFLDMIYLLVYHTQLKGTFVSHQQLK